MAAQKDSSVLFSLKELMSLEDDRVRQEESEKERRAHEERLGREMREQQVRDQEVARMRAAEAERRAYEERARAEAARLDAIRHAEVERARIEAENAARMDSVKRQHEHERELAALHENSGRKKLVVILACLGLTLVLGVGIGGYALHQFRQTAAAAQAEATKLQQDILRIDEQKKALEAARTGKSAEEIRVLEQRLKELQDERQRISNGGGAPVIKRGPVAPTQPAKVKNPPNCQKACATGDPLCVECR